MRDFPFIVDGAWAPGGSDLDHAAGCALGRQHADLLVDAINTDRNPSLLGAIVSRMTLAGRYEAVEVGFFARIGELLLV